MLHSPYGQFIFALWRGSENRKNIKLHAENYHKEILDLLLNGHEFLLPNGDREFINIVPIMCADLSFIKEIIGKCSCTSKFGCFYCKKPLKDWTENSTIFEAQSINEMIVAGNAGEKYLGEYPQKGSKAYTEFQQSHYGQYGPPLLKAVDVFLIPFCGLHMILAMHRYLWSYLSDLIERRKQSNIIVNAFTDIGCTYLAFQHACYLKAKNKCYDGSTTLKMIGADCKLLENNIDKFISHFLRDKETFSDISFERLHHAVALYHSFRDIAIDIRSVEYNAERSHSVKARIEKFINLFCKYSGCSVTSGKPYLHILRDHFPEMMEFWGQYLNWGYGYFNCNGGEHLNKRIKCMEFDVTNMKEDRFVNIMKHMRVKQFFYPDQTVEDHRIIRCQACKEIGHNKKNKSCPFHPQQVQMYFSDTDDED